MNLPLKCSSLHFTRGEVIHQAKYIKIPSKVVFQLLVIFVFVLCLSTVIPSLLSGWVYFSTGSSIAKMCYGTREVAFFQMCGLEGYVYVFVVSKKSFSHPSSGVCERIGAVRDFILI